VINALRHRDLHGALTGWHRSIARQRADDIVGFQIKQANMEILRMGGISLHAWNTYVANMTTRCLERSVASWALNCRSALALEKFEQARKKTERSAADARAAIAEALRVQRAIEEAEVCRRLLQRLAKEVSEMYQLDRAVTSTLLARLAAGFERFGFALESDRDWKERLVNAAKGLCSIRAAHGLAKWIWIAKERTRRLTALQECNGLRAKLRHGRALRCLQQWVVALGARFAMAVDTRKATRFYDKRGVKKRLRHWRAVNKSITFHQSPAMLIENQRLYNLGICYQRGEGVTRDQGKAIQCFEKAAKRGFQPAQFNLGMVFFKGDGVPRNIVKGMSLLGDAGVFFAAEGAHKMHAAERKLPSQPGW
jgi:tetratricopeptide (TPR) repeat protein